jgi:hypothetical protein
LGGCHTARVFKAASIRTLLMEVGAYVVECKVAVVKAEKEESCCTDASSDYTDAAKDYAPEHWNVL